MQHDTDPLYRCIKALCHHENIDFPGDSLLAGIALTQGTLSIDDVQTIADRLNLTAKTQIKRQLSLQAIQQPTIINTHDDNYVLVLEQDLESHQITVYNPVNDGIEKKTLSEIQHLYAGTMITLQQTHRAEARSHLSENNHQNEDWFNTIIRGIRKTYPYVIVATLFINLLSFVIPLFVMNVYDRVIPHQALSTLWAFSIGAIAFVLLDLILKIARGVVLEGASGSINNQLAHALFKHSMNMKLNQSNLSLGSYIQTAKDLVEVRSFYTTATLSSMVDFPFILLYLVIIYSIAGTLVYVPLIGILAVLICNIAIQPFINRSIKTVGHANNQKQAIQMEALNTIETIKSLAAENVFLKRFKQCADLEKDKPSLRVYFQLSANLSGWITNSFSVFLIIYGAHLIFAREISVGALVASSIISGRVMTLAQVCQLLFNYRRMKLAMSKIKQLMTQPIDYNSNTSYFYTKQLKGNIDINNVHFHYPSTPREILNQIRIQIREKEKIALVGNIGSGKSTLLKLLIDLHTPSSGTITVDKIDIRQIDPALLRTQIHYMPASTELFYGTLKDNITISNPSASAEDIVRAAEHAGVMRFMDDLPKGFETLIDERGSNLSAGQRQCVCLARAILANAHTYLLDEPTAYVDNAIGSETIKAFFKEKTEATIIMVTHRPALLQHVDRIICLERGQVIKDGPRDDMIKAIFTQTKNNGTQQ